MGKDIDARECPYCHKIIRRPYWVHIQRKHSAEYEKNETWIQLYRDYESMGMQKDMCLMVISELFNVSQDDVESYLKKNNVL